MWLLHLASFCRFSPQNRASSQILETLSPVLVNQVKRVSLLSFFVLFSQLVPRASLIIELHHSFRLTPLRQKKAPIPSGIFSLCLLPPSFLLDFPTLLRNDPGPLSLAHLPPMFVRIVSPLSGILPLAFSRPLVLPVCFLCFRSIFPLPPSPRSLPFCNPLPATPLSSFFSPS